jgi:hypothetical protein
MKFMSNIEEFHRKNTNRSAPKIHPQISAPTPQHNPLACSSVLSRSSMAEGRGRAAEGRGQEQHGRGARARSQEARATRGGARPRRTGACKAEGARAARGRGGRACARRRMVARGRRACSGWPRRQGRGDTKVLGHGSARSRQTTKAERPAADEGSKRGKTRRAAAGQVGGLG